MTINSVTFNDVFYAINEDAVDRPPMIVIRPKVSNVNGTQQIEWESTTQSVLFKIKEIENLRFSEKVVDYKHSPKEIKITTTAYGYHYTLRPLTTDVYYKQMTNIPNKPHFSNDEELRRHYLNFDRFNYI